MMKSTFFPQPLAYPKLWTPRVPLCGRQRLKISAISTDDSETPESATQAFSRQIAEKVLGTSEKRNSIRVEKEIAKLAARLEATQKALQESESRQAAIAPYRVSIPKRGIIGNSRYAATLRKSVMQAARDTTRAPVFIIGEPGVEKTSLAAMIHNSSPFYKFPLVCIDCDRLDDQASELLGRGAKKGLLDWLPNQATLILNNVHKAPPSVLPLLQREVATATYASSMDDDGVDELTSGSGIEDIADPFTSSSSSFSTTTMTSDIIRQQETQQQQTQKQALPPCTFPRLILTAEQRVPVIEEYCTLIKVPPLRVRSEDINGIASYMLRSLAKQRGLGTVVLSNAALRQLEAFQYPNNVRELKAALERAVAQVSKTSSAEEKGTPAHPRVVTEDVLWFANPAKERLRMDLLTTWPILRKVLRSPIWPDAINFNFTIYAFAAMIAILFLGPQDREHNFALNLFWNYWWPGILPVYIFLGRIWCAVCPFQITGQIFQNNRLSTGGKLLKWPKETFERWGPWFLFWLFGAILVWEEVWDLPHTAYLSAWLLLLITGGAVFMSVIWERRAWCRYWCPIGGMNGLMAKLSLLELRARQGVCSAECDTYTCYKGGPAVPPEGQESTGCPLYSHPAQLTDNRNCVLCMECLRACPHKSIELKFRVPGADLWDGTHLPLPAEVALMFQLLGAVYLHDLPTMLYDMGIPYDQVAGGTLPHIGMSIVFLSVPGLVAWGVDQGWRVVAGGGLVPTAAFAAATGNNASSNSISPATGDATAARAIAVLQAASASYASQQTNAVIQAPGKPFLDIAYGYLPLVWAATLAYYLDNFFFEAGRILPATALTFGLDDVATTLPAFVAHPAVVDALQATVLAAGAALSLGMTRRLAKSSWASVAPQCALIVGFTAVFWHTMVRG